MFCGSCFTDILSYKRKGSYCYTRDSRNILSVFTTSFLTVLFCVVRYENLMQINLETSEVDEISEIHTKLLRVSI